MMSNPPKPSLTEYRVSQLEEAHVEMKESLGTLNEIVREIVTEIRVSKKFVAGIVIFIGLAQPFIFFYLTNYHGGK